MSCHRRPQAGRPCSLSGFRRRATEFDRARNLELGAVMDHGAPRQEADREHAGASATHQNFVLLLVRFIIG
jgi:hypothetical protein